MVALFVPLAALRRLLNPCELPPRQHAAKFLCKGDDGWVWRVLQRILTAAHFA
jgi:hypothetical protein